MDDVIGFSSTFQRFAASEFSGSAGSMPVAEVNIVRLATHVIYPCLLSGSDGKWRIVTTLPVQEYIPHRIVEVK
jgi:hypothetical protein